MRMRTLASFGLILLLSAGCTDSPAVPESEGEASAFGAGRSATQRDDDPVVVSGGAEAGSTTAADSSASRGGGAIGSGN